MNMFDPRMGGMPMGGQMPPMSPMEPKIPRFTRPMAEDMISMAVRVPKHMLNYERISDVPRMWKHACVPAGVVPLLPKRLDYPGGMGQYVEFCFCSACGTVVYYMETVN